MRIMGIIDYEDDPLETSYRDAKLGAIGEGASEIQRLIVAREILRP